MNVPKVGTPIAGLGPLKRYDTYRGDHKEYRGELQCVFGEEPNETWISAHMILGSADRAVRKEAVASNDAAAHVKHEARA